MIDGAGHKLLGSGYNETYGVIINNRNNVALINTEISGFHSGGVSLGNFGMEDLKDGSVALIALFLTTQ